MRISHALLKSALLGSVFAVAALAPAAAGQSRADLERTLAITGRHSSATQSANAARWFSLAHTPSTYTVLHSFSGNTGDGDDPTAEPTLDSSGNLFAVTDYGGADSNGTLVEFAPSGTETLVHSFGATGDGTQPDGAVIFDASGNMYGTTQNGGTGSNGTIWELAANGTYSVLHDFTGSDGSFIRGRLVRDKKGNLYGTALFGGANGDGSVFKYGTDGTLTVLHSFNGTDGEFPEHGVVMDKAGNLYGVTAFGGASGNGAVYEVAKDGTFSTLYSFTGGTDGGFLYGGPAIDKKGNLYGSTVDDGASGAGTVFKLAPDGTLTTLYSFTGGADGGNPEGDMLLAGKALYSTATSGGSSTAGVVYEVTLKGKEKVLANLSTADGDSYAAGVIVSGKNTFYGTTSAGGADGFGVVFSLKK